MDRRTHGSVQKDKTKNHGVTVSGTSYFKLSEHINQGHEHKRSRGHALARTTRRKMKQIGFASRFLSDTKKKYAINEMKLLGVVWGLERVPPICLRETDKITHGPPSTRTIN